MRLSASLVLYNNKQALFESAIASFLAGSSNGELWVIDNSPQPLQSMFFEDNRVHYFFNGENIGFGAGHNVAVRKACAHSDAHLILNPDVRFDAAVLPRLLQVLQEDVAVAAVMPKVLYPDGSLQKLCKLLPTPLDLLMRRFVPFPWLRAKMDARYELHALSQSESSDIPSLSGCFLLVRSRFLAAEDGFDEQYFMYMEDVDLVRRLGRRGKTMYTPDVSIIHEYAKGSYGNKKLLGYHLNSAVRYFNKWGWFFDFERQKKNSACLRKI